MIKTLEYSYTIPFVRMPYMLFLNCKYFDDVCEIIHVTAR